MQNSRPFLQPLPILSVFEIFWKNLGAVQVVCVEKHGDDHDAILAITLKKKMKKNVEGNSNSAWKLF